MILSAHDLGDDHVLRADICIVGAGAAGISLALALMDSGLQVLLLESGGLEFDARNQSLYDGAVIDGRLHSPPIQFRRRQFGGSTTIWGGRCTPFDAIDFERRNFIPHSGWPIGLDALMPYYPAANRICEAGEFAYIASEALRKPLRPMIQNFQSGAFTDEALERFSCPTNFAQRYGHKLAAASHVRVVLHANVTNINLSETSSEVDSVRVQTLSGRRLQAQAKQFVLATGGLEVPRLLLASRDREPRGIGNTYDVVGRYYMCHLAGTIGVVRFNGSPLSIHHGYDICDDGVYCRRRLALLPETQRALHLGNFIARLHHPRIPDPAHKSAVLSLLFLARAFVPKEYAKRLHGDDSISAAQWLRHLGNLVAHPFDAAAFAWHMLRDRKFSDRKFPSIIVRSRANLYSLDFHSEQQPNPDSRIRLGSELDALGLPEVLIDWRYTRGDVDTARRAIALLALDLERSGVGKLEYEADHVEAEMIRYGAYGGHHIGTARMGTDPRTSVVDADCRVHCVRNLFVAGAAVFPTSSQANPTLTIVALALRLATHLRVLSSSAPAAVKEPSVAPHRVAMDAPISRVLVLGSAEYIGGRVLQALAASASTRPVADIARLSGPSHPNIEHRSFEPTEPASLARAMEGVGAVVNCLSGRPAAILGAARALFDMAPRCSTVPLVVHVSSMSVYGTVAGDVAEDMPLRRDLGPYARAKVLAEELAAPYERKVILRPGCEYGPGGELWSGRVAHWLFQRRIGDLGAGGDGICNLVHIDDLVQAVLLSLQQPAAVGHAFNLAMPDPPTWNEYLVRYAKALGAVPVKRVSGRRLAWETKVLAMPLKTFEIASRKSGLAPHVPPAIPASFLRLARQEIRLDSSRARHELGWECRSLQQGLAQTAAWFLATNGRPISMASDQSGISTRPR